MFVSTFPYDVFLCPMVVNGQIVIPWIFFRVHTIILQKFFFVIVAVVALFIEAFGSNNLSIIKC